MGNRMTVGVALAIPEPHAAVLAGWRRRIGDPEADKVPPHVTLLPPTEIEADQLELVEKHLAEAATAVLPFTMRLSGTGSFRPVSQVVFVQVSSGIAQCELLERAVRRDPIVREVEFPYHPHVTVGHDLADERLDEAYEGLQDFVAQFRVEAFTLYTQNGDGAWRPHREYPLTGL
ncbi:MAG TPA: 2'-5' RNA ligase family protein [Jatrophihabitans sp.]|jgi:2'-5' RNA ligase|uniref:2'-5' RNA ligase family protein n=1 Tax=Jatrophihabitans sp. TaxID=1932789 RepID=UPI002F0BB62B